MAIADAYGLTPAQAGILFHAAADPDSDAYLNHLEFEVAGPLDVDAFTAAFGWVAERHAVLRSSFHWTEADEPLQVVHDQVGWRPVLHDLRELAGAAQRTAAADLIAARQAEPMDLTVPPLMRLDLIRLSDRRTVGLWTYHHLVLDGWSLAVMYGDLLRRYRAGAGYDPPPPRPFREHVAWLHAADAAAAASYWSAELAGAAFTQLAVPRPPAAPGYGRRAVSLDTAAIEALARTARVTPGVVLHAAWALVLARYAGTDDVVFGTVVSGRPATIQGVEQMVGMFINTVPVRVRIDRRRTAGDFLRGQLAAQSARDEHDHVPLVEIRRQAGLPPGDELFGTLLAVENFPVEVDPVTLGDDVTIRLSHAVEHTHYPLTITVLPGPVMTVEAEYRRDACTDEIVTGMLDSLAHAVDALATGLDRPIGQLSLLPPGQAAAIAAHSNGAPAAVGRNSGRESTAPGTDVVDAFLTHTRTSPQAPAVIANDGATMSYAELDAASAALARWLRGRGIGLGDTVAFQLTRTPQLAVAMLGILRCGATYLPIDQDTPRQRVQTVLAESQAVLLLDEPTIRSATATSATEPLPASWPASAPAYMIFTSGSTGTPKGVLVSRGTLGDHIQTMVAAYEMTSDDRMLQIASPAFDLAAEEFFPAWAVGGAVVLAPDRLPGTVADFAAFLDRTGVTVVNMAAAYWHQWVMELTRLPLPPRLRLASIGAEPIWRTETGEWLDHAGPVKLFNAYGVTEATITTTLFEAVAPLPGTEMLPIGRPLPGMSVYLLDRIGDPVPPGVIGELYIGGIGVATGYAGRPAATAERFVPAPAWASAMPAGPDERPVAVSAGRDERPVAVSAGRDERPAGVPAGAEKHPPAEGSRWYRTGDLGYWLADGSLVLTGRADDQVKIRGHRVEPAEVEAVIAGHPAVTAVAVAAYLENGEPALAAYLVTEAIDEVRTDCEAALASYLRPAAWIRLDRMPMLPSGKIDRVALPAPSRTTEARDTAIAAPATGTQEWVADTWRDVLGTAAPGRADRFFSLGGHSLTATQVVARARRAFSADLPLRSLLGNPTLAEFARAIDAARRPDQQQALPPLRPLEPGTEAPLSFTQERLWFLHHLEGGGPSYNITAAWRLDGPLSAARLRAALAQVVARHDVLRTSYPDRGGIPFAMRRDRIPVDLPIQRCPDEPAAIQAALAAEAHHQFDLATGPLFRFRLLQLAPLSGPERHPTAELSGPERHPTAGAHVLVINVHHIVFDGWSHAILMTELASCYDGGDNQPSLPKPTACHDDSGNQPSLPEPTACHDGDDQSGLPEPTACHDGGNQPSLPEPNARHDGGNQPSLPELDAQYADFAAWQRSWLTGDRLDGLLGYWKQALADLPPALALPTTWPHSAPPRYVGGQHRFTIDPQAHGAARALARDTDATLFVVLLAAFAAFLHRITSQDDVVIGTPVAGRLLPETEALIGCFFNTLALRSRTTPGITFRELTESVRETAYAAYDHQEAPFEKVIEAVNVSRDLDQQPLTQVMFVFQNTPHHPLHLKDLTATALTLPEPAKLDLILTMAEENDTLVALWEYNAAVLSPTAIATFTDSFTTLLSAATTSPDGLLQTLPVLSAAQRRAALQQATGPASHRPLATLPALFTAQAARTPLAPAVINHQGHITTYAALDHASTELAATLQASGVSRGTSIGIALTPDKNLPVALLAVLKAAATYVPLDPTAPSSRLAAQCADADIRLVLTDQQVAPSLSELPFPLLSLPLGEGASHLGLRLSAPPNVAGPSHWPPPAPEDLAYVLFTSGSTGRPKGVAVSHQNLAAYLRWFSGNYKVAASDRSLAYIRYSFDLSVPELYAPLLTGGAVVLADPERRTDPRHLTELARSAGVTVIAATPSVLRLLADDGGLGTCDALRLIVTCGEPLPSDLIKAVAAQTNARLDNQYGPTETTVAVTAWPSADRAPGGPIAPLGQPIDDCQIYLHDPSGLPVPPGTVAEIQIGGEQVARGYIGSPGLTADRFRPDPYASTPGARLYRTGDLARLRADGELEYVGRADRQVKVRGIRVEPGEVEAAITSHPLVRQAVVIADGGRLVAFVVPATGDGQGPPDLGAFLASRLPSHLIPAALLPLTELPHSPNGKIDYAALARQAIPEPAAMGYVEPATPSEAEVAAIYAGLLGQPRVGAADDFFELGGQSLLAVRAVTQIRHRLGVDLPLRTVFAAPTVAALAREVDELLLASADEQTLAALLDEFEAPETLSEAP